MTPIELKSLIDSDEQASAFAAVGNDSGCAARCMEIAPRVYRECRLSRLGILSLYADPVAGMTVLGTIDAVAQGNPVVAEILRFMQPGVDAVMLPDFGLPSIRAALTTPIEAGGLGLSEELASPIIAAGEQPQSISAEDVAGAMKPYRENA